MRTQRVLALATSATLVYTAARVSVLFIEAISVIKSERHEDVELLELCYTGQARGSSKMRDACLRARADLSSPVLFKALLRAVNVAFKDFSDSVGSPSRLALVVLFLFSSFVLPMGQWLRFLAGMRADAPVARNCGDVHFLSFAPPPQEHTGGNLLSLSSIKNRFRRSGGGGSESDMEPGLAHSPAWTSIDIGGHDKYD